MAFDSHHGQPSHIWSPDTYHRHARFVSELGADILSWLAPSAGERILDIGCGDGVLSQKISASCAEVVGVDTSAEMVERARGNGIDARVGSGEVLKFTDEFDAVFSNAALHWMTNSAAVAGGVSRALKSGGRFVAEFGGQGNVAAIATALQAAWRRYGGEIALAFPWYFPSEAEYSTVLSDAGLQLCRSELVPRPTPLPSEMSDWIELFLHPYFDQFQGEERAEIMNYVVDLLRPSLCDVNGKWTADYVRLRIEANKTP